MSLLDLSLVPVWFYVYSAVAYGIAALVSLLIGYFAYRIFKRSGVNLGLMMAISFFLLTIGFTVLTLSSVNNYVSGSASQVFESLGRINNLAFFSYYILSSVSYSILLLMYLPKKLRFHVLYVPLWYISSDLFHLLALILIGTIFAINLVRYLKKKNRDKGLVVLAFAFIVVYHLVLFALPFNVTLYLIAHLILVLGFLSLFFMLIRVRGR